MDTCKGCGQRIDWIQTAKGKKMPVDPEEVTIITRGGVIYKGFISHFATCPEAAKFKKSEGPTPGVAHLSWQCPSCHKWYNQAHDCRECGTRYDKGEQCQTKTDQKSTSKSSDAPIADKRTF